MPSSLKGKIHTIARYVGVNIVTAAHYCVLRKVNKLCYNKVWYFCRTKITSNYFSMTTRLCVTSKVWVKPSFSHLIQLKVLIHSTKSLFRVSAQMVLFIAPILHAIAL